MNVDETDLVTQLTDAGPLRPEAYERARAALRAAMAESGPARVPEMTPVPGTAPLRRKGFPRARNHRRGTLGTLGKVGIGAGIGAVAAGVAIVLVATSAPRSAAPGSAVPAGSGSSAPAVSSPLVSLAARITATSGPLPGNASLIIRTQTEGRIPPQVSYNLYTDSGAFYGGGDKKSLMEAVARHENLADGITAREVAAARYAATGDLATARVRMADASPNDLGLGLSLAARKKIWEKARAAADEILKEKGTRYKLPPNPPTGKTLQGYVDNYVWNNSVDALSAGAGNPQVRAGVLRLLSTISGVTVAHSTTHGQPALTLTAGPEVFGGTGKQVLTINARTGMPVSSWMGDLGPRVPSSVDTYQVSRVTLAGIEAGKF